MRNNLCYFVPEQAKDIIVPKQKFRVLFIVLNALSYT